MSSSIEVNEEQQQSSIDETAGTSTATEGEIKQITANLTTLDKIKRFFFSKEEWEAYLLEKLEEQKKRKEGKDQNNYEPFEDPNDKRSVVAWIKTVFPSQEDANSFLKLQLEKLQEVKDEKDAKEAKEVKQVKEVAIQKPATITTITTAVQPSVDTKPVDRK